MNPKGGGSPLSARDAGNDGSRRMFNAAAVFLLLSFLLFLCQVINFGVFKTSARGSNSLPVSIRAASQADYSGDNLPQPIPPISENILRQIIMDMPSTASPQDRLATLEFVLSQTVPTMTPDMLFTATFTPTRTPTPTRTASRTPAPTTSKTRTPSPTPTKSFTPAKTATPTQTTTPTPTRTPTPTSTTASQPPNTVAATATPTQTATRMIPTNTPSPTSTSTSTEVILPTETHTPTPTSVDVAPPDSFLQTSTPACTLTSDGISISGNEVLLTLTNNWNTTVTITSISIDWVDVPESQSVTEIFLNGATIVNTDDPKPPSDYPSERHWAGEESDLELPPSVPNLLVLMFSDEIQGGYSITVNFDNGCSLSESN